MQEAFAYHQLDITINTSDPLPYFAGSMLRGAFGFALKQCVCVNPSLVCEGCIAQKQCLYFDFYEKPNTYHLYRFEAPLGSNNFSFSLKLFSSASLQLPYILSALQIMLTKYGLGAGRKKYFSYTIACDGAIVFDGKEFDLSSVKENIFIPQPISEAFTLRFITPLRMKSGNELLKESPVLKQILLSIHQRYEAMMGRERTALGYEPSYHQTFARTHLSDLSRYSSRQETKLKTGGLMGEIGYSAVDERSKELLGIGELIGVGKQTVFGLGAILIQEAK